MDARLNSPLNVNRRFGGTYRLHFQGRRISQAWNSVKDLLATSFHPRFFLGLFFDPEDGGDIFLRKFGWLYTEYMALYPRILFSSVISSASSSLVRIFAILHFYKGTKPFPSCKTSRVIDYDWNFSKSMFLLRLCSERRCIWDVRSVSLRRFSIGMFPEGTSGWEFTCCSSRGSRILWSISRRCQLLLPFSFGSFWLIWLKLSRVRGIGLTTGFIGYSYGYT
jgi:hypothetical protein